MNREQYINALTWCYQVEAVGAIAGEVGMLLRPAPNERTKLDCFRRLEASNKLMCLAALEVEGITRPTIEPAMYRAGYKLGLRFGEGSWWDFLDRFEATLHPSLFARFVPSDGQPMTPDYVGVQTAVFLRLMEHEEALARFVALERAGRDDSIAQVDRLLQHAPGVRLIAPEEPVGW